MTQGFAMQGNTYYSNSFDQVTYMCNCIICVDDNGFIEAVYREEDKDYLTIKDKYMKNGKLRVLTDNEVILPGFVDLHIHAPQWAQAGTALDKPLEVWLNEYTFPLEAQFEDIEFARKVYTDVVSTTLNNGTTTAVYFATIHRESSVLLAKTCGEMGQRGFVGKVAMDDVNGTLDFYRDETAESSISETEAFIKEVLNLQTQYKQQVYPVVTPRFIPTSTTKSLKGLGELAKRYNVHIQTHVSESDWAHHFVKEKMNMNDTAALDGFGLLTDKTIVAHAPFLEPEDRKVMCERKVSIAHCPVSNAYFANSVLPMKHFFAEGINIGLATDISGGYSPSIYQAIRQAVISSKMLQDGVNPELGKDIRGRDNSVITLNNAFYCATVGGGIAMNIPVGKIEKGYCFDVQIINIEENIPTFYKEKTPEDLLHKVLLLAQTSNIVEVWVQGNRYK